MVRCVVPPEEGRLIDVRSDRPAAFDEEERTLVARVAERLAARLG